MLPTPAIAPTPGTNKRLDDPATREAFLSAIVEHGTISGACRELGLDRPTVFVRMVNDTAFEALVRASQRAALEQHADECIEISDDSRHDYRDVTVQGKTVRVFDPEHVARARLRIETRLKIIGKLNQSVWGEKPAQVTLNSQTVVGIVCTEEQRARLIAMREALTAQPSLKPIEAELVRDLEATGL